MYMVFRKTELNMIALCEKEGSIADPAPVRRHLLSAYHVTRRQVAGREAVPSSREVCWERWTEPALQEEHTCRQEGLVAEGRCSELSLPVAGARDGAQTELESCLLSLT